MRSRTFWIILAAGLMALGFQLLWTQPVSASPIEPQKSTPVPAPPTLNTELVLASPGDVNLSDPFILSGILKDQTGAGLADRSINFSIFGDYLTQTRTKADGTFSLTVNKDLAAGAYWITAAFNGAHLLAPSTATAVLNIRPAKVVVQTVPAVAGIPFKMDDRQFVSGADGSASIQIYKVGIYPLDVLIDQYQIPGQKITFGRWTEESYLPSRDVRVPTNDVIQVGLNVFHEVNLKFVDLDGFPVDNGRISGITIKTAQGDVFNFSKVQSSWLPASRTARRDAGLEETKLQYSVISVMIDGSNVVNQAQQRFYANVDDTWTISLILYTLHIEARDGLFGSPVGKNVVLQFPDGQSKTYPLDKSGTIDIHSLARGIYHLELTGTNGLSSDIPVALSRNQDVSAKVITYLDIGVVATLSVAFALGLLFYGRPWLLRMFIRKKQPITQESKWNSIHEN